MFSQPSASVTKLASSDKRKLLHMVACCLVGLLASTMQGQTYCWPTGQMACFYGDKITRVSFAGIDHTDAVCSEDGHGKKDLSAAVPAGVVVPGQTYVLSVSVENNNTSSGTEWLRAWIDHDRNGVFAASECIDLGMATGNATLNVNVTIPSDAALGNTRLRVMYRRTNQLTAGDACHSYGSYRGQVKDYSLRVERPLALPVELIAFALNSTQEGVQVTWTSAGEINSASYTIEHTVDTDVWEMLAVEPSIGYSNGLQHYGYMHKGVQEGLHYYHLLQTDRDGKTRSLGIRSIVVQRAQGTAPYPDPCTDHIRIQVHTQGPFHVIHLASGQLIPVGATQVDEDEWVLDTSAIPAGIYAVRAHEHGRSRCVRFVKQ